jgi:hypothetical protein
MKCATTIFYLAISFCINTCEANFEDTRCRCICPSTEFFRTHNVTADETSRRYYTMTKIRAETCNSQTVVKKMVEHKTVDDARLDAFLANCNCKFESRNSVLLKVVVFFVICVLFGLGSYMAYLVVVDPILKRERAFIPYRRQDDDVGFSNTFWFSVSDDSDETLDENIFAQPVSATSPTSDDSESIMSGGLDGVSSSPSTSMQMRTRGPQHVFEKVEAEQNKWMSKVEEQRRNVLTNHTILN